MLSHNIYQDTLSPTLALELGCKRFDWTAESDNPQAVEFYDALGATRVEEKIYFRLGA